MLVGTVVEVGSLSLMDWNKNSQVKTWWNLLETVDGIEDSL